METIQIRDVGPADFERILALNAAAVVETSALDLERLRRLDGLSAWHRVAVAGGEVAGFLLAIREGAAYRNDNFEWFAARLPRFLYVDRIVVGADQARRGVGRALYLDLFTQARRQGVDRVVCEYDLDPPNPASRAFHDRFGFREAGRQRVAGGTKLVSLQVAEVGSLSTTPPAGPACGPS